MSKKSASANKGNISTGYLLNHIANDWQKKLNVVFSDYAIDYVQYALLNALQAHNNSKVVATQVMLSNFAGIDKMTTSKTIRVLEEQKLLKRSESKTDSRAKSVEITDKGRKTFDTATKLLEKFEKEFFRNLYKADKSINSKLETLL